MSKKETLNEGKRVIDGKEATRRKDLAERIIQGKGRDRTGFVSAILGHYVTCLNLSSHDQDKWADKPG